jgi:hypothetical protein
VAEDINDKIIEVVDAVREESQGRDEFTVNCSETDIKYKLVPTQTKTFIEGAATQLGYEIVVQGSNLVSLRRKRGGSGRIIRA